MRSKFIQAIYINRLYFILFTIFLLVGLALLFLFDKHQHILFLLQFRSPFMDQVFLWSTRMAEPVMYFMVFLILSMRKIRYGLLVPLTGLAGMVISELLKAVFRHERPATYLISGGFLEHIPTIDGLILDESFTAFPSGHTIAGFALFSLLAVLSREKIVIPMLCLTGALLVGISRMYLFQHFLKDVVFGAAVGVIVALLVYVYQSKRIFPAGHFMEQGLVRWMLK